MAKQAASKKATAKAMDTAANGEDYFHKTKYPLADLAKLANRVEAGESIQKVLVDTGITYSAGWNYLTWRALNRDGGAIDCSEMTEAKFNTLVADLRDKKHHSWGLIMAETNRTEGKVRKAYEAKTNVRSVGTRNEHGGRFLADEETLYRGDGEDGTSRAKVGPRINVGTSTNDAITQASK